MVLDGAQALRTAEDPRREVACALEALVLKHLLSSSGAFRAGEAAGAQLWSDVFAEAVAEAVAHSGGGLGLAPLLESHLPQPTPAPAPQALLAGAATLTSGFGSRVDPFTGERHAHLGVDLAAPLGTPILAAQDGVVVSAGPRGGYGNAVEVAHPDGTTSLYAHAHTLLVRPGQEVRAGEPLATVGSTGRSTGNHLHFELRRAGRPIDPRSALQKYVSRVEDAGESQSGERSP